MTEHLTFILDKEFNSDTCDKYKCKSNPNFIIYLPHSISRKNNNFPKFQIRISID